MYGNMEDIQISLYNNSTEQRHNYKQLDEYHQIFANGKYISYSDNQLKIGLIVFGLGVSSYL